MKYPKILTSYVEEAYQLFSSYTIDKHLSVCDCGNCITLAEIEELCYVPLKQLSLQQISNYVEAMLVNTDKAIIEVHYFLPRMLEFLCERKIFYIDEGFSLSKCHFERLDLWKPTEIDFLQRFSIAFFEEILKEENFEHITAEHWLVCFGLAGLPLQPLLECWTNRANTISAIWHFQDIFLYSLTIKGIKYHHIYFEENHSFLNTQITEWLQNPQTLQTFYKAIENLLLSDISLDESFIIQLENTYNIIENISQELKLKVIK